MRLEKARGTVVPLITPLNEDESIDYSSLKGVIDHIIGGGAEGIFQLATSGEFARLSQEERYALARATVSHAKGRTAIYLGISDTATKQVLQNLAQMENLEPDFIVVSLPYYYPVQDKREIIDFFTAVARSTKLPILLYNIPATCGGSIPLSAMEHLVQIENIVGIKDSSSDVEYFKGLIRLKKSRPEFCVLVGDESVISQCLRLGGDGQVPSLANTFPKLFVEIWRLACKQNWPEMEKWIEIINNMNKMNLYSGSWMSAIGWRKAGLSLMGLCKPYLTNPHVPLGPEETKRVGEFVKLYNSLF